MRKLGKKIHSTEETIEAYCRSCSNCGCNGSCYYLCKPGDPSYLSGDRERANIEFTKAGETMSGSYVKLG